MNFDFEERPSDSPFVEKVWRTQRVQRHFYLCCQESLGDGHHQIPGQAVHEPVLAGGTASNLEGLHPGLMEGLEEMPPAALDGTPWKEAYDKVAPNPEDWATLVTKKSDLDRHYQPWTPEQIQSLKAPMLIIVGDSDIVRPEHVVEMFRQTLKGLGSLLGVLPLDVHIVGVNGGGNRHGIEVQHRQVIQSRPVFIIGQDLGRFFQQIQVLVLVKHPGIDHLPGKGDEPILPDTKAAGHR